MAHADKEYKVILVGDPAVGKTAFVRRFVTNQFDTGYRATMGVEYSSKIVHVDGTSVKINLWDIVGQERFRSMTRSFYKMASGAFILCDVTQHDTLDQAIAWKRDVDEKVSLPSGKSLPCLLIANKIDLEAQMTDDKISSVAQTRGFYSFYKTSVKENLNVEESVISLSREMLRLDKAGAMLPVSSSSSNNLILDSEQKSAGNSCNC
ncbi:ras-related protein Rab-7L1-like [Oscarella lobularis]|uniref:ras-related protein Rab-7L1-like n=1 Tax=Oscarella lobularis TaxID=121494 RepID=UPI0033140645